MDCPICGESDMHKEREPDAEGDEGYVTCTNLTCGSNGGDNFSALTPEQIGIVSMPNGYDESIGQEILSFGKAIRSDWSGLGASPESTAGAVYAYGMMRAAKIARGE